MSNAKRTHLKWAAILSIILGIIAAVWVFANTQISITVVHPNLAPGVCGHGLEPEVISTPNSIGKRIALSAGGALGGFFVSFTSYMLIYGVLAFFTFLKSAIVTRLTREPSESDAPLSPPLMKAEALPPPASPAPAPSSAPALSSTPAPSSAPTATPEPIAEQELKGYLFFHLKWLSILSIVVALGAASIAFVPNKVVTERTYYAEYANTRTHVPRFTTTPLTTSERLSAASKAGTSALIKTSLLYLLIQSLYMLLSALFPTIRTTLRRFRVFNTSPSSSYVPKSERLPQNDAADPPDADGRV